MKIDTLEVQIDASAVRVITEVIEAMAGEIVKLQDEVKSLRMRVATLETFVMVDE